jgi:hypothetical protein
MNRLVSFGLFFVMLANAGCRSLPAADDSFDKSEKSFTGQHSRIIEAASKALTEAQILPERQFQTYDGATVIVAHPAASPAATGSLMVRLKEVGFDDTSVTVQIQKTLMPSPSDRTALASRIFNAIASAQTK